MKKRLSLAFAAAAALALVPMHLNTGHHTTQAMTCSPDEPFNTACRVVFGTVLGTVCTGHLPKAPNPGATTSATIGWPVHGPPLG